MFKVKTLSEYPYLYETHCHSSESSACARNTAVEMAMAHKRAGYAGMVLTNHNWGGHTSIDRDLGWRDFITQFFEPYYLAKEWGDANDFLVMPGYEAGYNGTEFLIYGVEIDWILDHPELRDATVSEQFDIIHSGGGIVVHAHPFREAFYIEEIRLYPKLVDGVEALNASNAPEINEKALKYARELGMFITGGSDTHMTALLGAGVAFDTKLTGINDLVGRLQNAEPHDYVVTDGRDYFDAYGGKL